MLSKIRPNENQFHRKIFLIKNQLTEHYLKVNHGE